jgi:hypothetical protein
MFYMQNGVSCLVFWKRQRKSGGGGGIWGGREGGERGVKFVVDTASKTTAGNPILYL